MLGLRHSGALSLSRTETLLLDKPATFLSREACVACRSVKRKCIRESESSPTCVRCTQLEEECVYQQRRRGRKVKNQSYFDKLNYMISILDPHLHTSSFCRQVSLPLFTTILAVAAKVARPQLYPDLVDSANRQVAQGFLCGVSNIEFVQTLSILTFWKPAEDGRGWSRIGYAIRLAYELRLNRKASRPLPQDEDAARKILNKERTWIPLRKSFGECVGAALEVLQVVSDELFFLPYAQDMVFIGAASAAVWLSQNSRGMSGNDPELVEAALHRTRNATAIASQDDHDLPAYMTRLIDHLVVPIQAPPADPTQPSALNDVDGSAPLLWDPATWHTADNWEMFPSPRLSLTHGLGDEFHFPERDDDFWQSLFPLTRPE
ncbi:hypothetical protein RQP46_007358 [Phenoliferia psychrophenolica]